MLSESDVLSHYRASSDASHRFWSYFQAISLGAAAFAWSQNATNCIVLMILTIGYIAFSFANRRLVISSQAEAIVASDCLKGIYAPRSGSQSEPASALGIAAVVNSIYLEKVSRVRMWHVTLTVTTILAVWLRPFIAWIGGTP